MIRVGKMLPMEVIEDVRTPVRAWCLRCWNIGRPRLDNIKSGQGGCETCGGKKRLSEQAARQRAREWGYIPDPDIPYVNDATKWPGRCIAEGHYCDPVLNSYKRSGPCQTCADHGFKPDRPALLYLVFKSKIHAAKIGICEDSPQNVRLYEHRRSGWIVLKKKSFHVGADARQVEKLVVRSWRDRGWMPVLDNGAAYDGYSETVSIDNVSVDDIWREVRAIADKVLLGEPVSND